MASPTPQDPSLRRFVGTTDDIMPSTRASMADSGQKLSRNLREGNYSAFAGNLVRGAADLPTQIGKDLYRPVGSVAEPLVRGAVNSVATAVTGNEKPLVPAPAPTAQPTSATQPKPNLKDPYAAENAAKLAAAGAQPTQTQQAPATVNRGTMSNADVAKVNPQGKVTMTREPNGTMSFSGTDVSGPVSYAGGDGQALPGKGLRGNGWGGMNVLDSSEGRAVNNRLAAQFDARIASEIAAAQQAARSAGEASGGTGFNSREARDLLSQAMTKQPGESRADFATRSGAAMKMLGMETDERGNIRTNDTSRRGQDITQSTTLRGQDMDLQGRVLPKQMEMAYAAQQRQQRAQAWQQSGGNARAAADYMFSNGLDGSDFLKVAGDAQTQDEKGRDAATKGFEHFMEADDKGNITDASRANVRAQIEKLVPGYFQMTQAERLREQPKAEGGLRVLQGANATRDTGFLPRWLGGDRGNPAITSLGDMHGGTLRNTGIVEGLWNNNVEIGDYAIDMPDGRTLRVPLEMGNADMFEYLNSQGVDTEKLRK